MTHLTESQIDTLVKGYDHLPLDDMPLPTRAIKQLRAERDELRMELDLAIQQAFHPLGDNHHNAALCPYCNPAYTEQAKTIAELRTALQSAEAERDRFKTEAARQEGQLHWAMKAIDAGNTNASRYEALRSALANSSDPSVVQIASRDDGSFLAAYMDCVVDNNVYATATTPEAALDALADKLIEQGKGGGM